MEKSKSRWCLILPLLQLGLAVALGALGYQQYQHEMAGALALWHYIAPAEIILHTINYPAAVLTGIFFNEHTFYLGIEHSPAKFITYVLNIALMWAGAGLLLDRRSQIRTRRHVLLNTLGILFGFFLLVAAIGTALTYQALLLIAAPFVWSFCFIVYFAYSLLRTPSDPAFGRQRLR
jgi:hypothetical protein